MLKIEELRLNIKKKILLYFSLFFLISFPVFDIYSSFYSKNYSLQEGSVSFVKKDTLATVIEYSIYFSSLLISKGDFVFYSSVAFTSLSLIYAFKKIVKRERPDKSDFKSFPSGHTAVTFLSLIFILKNIKIKPKKYSVLVFFSSCLMIFMIFNRILTKRHYISDTLFSIFIVTFVYFFCRKLSRSLFFINKTND